MYCTVEVRLIRFFSASISGFTVESILKPLINNIDLLRIAYYFIYLLLIVEADG